MYDIQARDKKSARLSLAPRKLFFCTGADKQRPYRKTVFEGCEYIFFYRKTAFAECEYIFFMYVLWLVILLCKGEICYFFDYAHKEQGNTMLILRAPGLRTPRAQ